MWRVEWGMDWSVLEIFPLVNIKDYSLCSTAPGVRTGDGIPLYPQPLTGISPSQVLVSLMSTTAISILHVEILGKDWTARILFFLSLFPTTVSVPFKTSLSLAWILWVPFLPPLVCAAIFRCLLLFVAVLFLVLVPVLLNRVSCCGVLGIISQLQQDQWVHFITVWIFFGNEGVWKIIFSFFPNCFSFFIISYHSLKLHTVHNLFQETCFLFIFHGTWKIYIVFLFLLLQLLVILAVLWDLLCLHQDMYEMYKCNYLSIYLSWEWISDWVLMSVPTSLFLCVCVWPGAGIVWKQVDRDYSFATGTIDQIAGDSDVHQLLFFIWHWSSNVTLRRWHALVFFFLTKLNWHEWMQFLYFFGNNLSGALPSQLGLLTALEVRK